MFKKYRAYFQTEAMADKMLVAAGNLYVAPIRGYLENYTAFKHEVKGGYVVTWQLM